MSCRGGAILESWNFLDLPISKQFFSRTTEWGWFESPHPPAEIETVPEQYCDLSPLP